MERSIIFNRVPNEFKSKYLASGRYGDCYLTKTNMVYKEFKNSKINHNGVINMSKLSNNMFAFPEILIYEHNVLVGYLMKYIEHASDLTSIDRKINLQELINEIRRLEDEIYYLSESNLIMHDINSKNILLNTNCKLYVIDTDNYYYSLISSDDALSDNMSGIATPILECLFGKQPKFISTNLNYDKRSCLLGDLEPSIFLSSTINELMNISRREIITVGDLQDNLSLILK